MPTARESLLNAAREAVERHPWPMVRMVEVAADAGVSRQTLSNEFGDKAGLGTALVERQLARFLEGFTDRLVDGTPAPDDTLARATEWILTTARHDRLVRATLTGCYGSALPPSPARPGELVAELTERAVRVLGERGCAADPGLAGRCETAVRLALSHVVAPNPAAEPAAAGAAAALGAGSREPPRPAQSPSWRSRVASRRRSE